jgi:hypothetical protein
MFMRIFSAKLRGRRKFDEEGNDFKGASDEWWRGFFENWEKRRDQKKTNGGKTREEGKEKRARLSSDSG